MNIFYMHSGTNAHDIHLLEFFKEHFPNDRIYLIASYNLTPYHLRLYKKMGIETIQLFPYLFKKNPLNPILQKIIAFPYYFYYLKKFKPKIIIASESIPWGFYAAVCNMKPLITILWGSDILLYPKKSAILKYITRYVLGQSNLTIVNSDLAKNEVNQLMAGSKLFSHQINSIIWFFNSYYLINFERKDEIRKQMKKELGWEKNPIIFSNRAIYPLYNVDKIVYSIPDLIKLNSNLRFLIINVGPQMKKLQNFITDNNCDKFVKFLGRLEKQEDMFDYLMASDIFISLSSSDSNPTSVIEAIMLSVPCIVSDIPANRMYIKHETNGLVVDYNDPEEIQNSILKLAGDSKFSEQCIRNYNQKLAPYIKRHSEGLQVIKQIKRILT
jgi:L-malate glycosyltransferase